MNIFGFHLSKEAFDALWIMLLLNGFVFYLAFFTKLDPKDKPHQSQ